MRKSTATVYSVFLFFLIVQMFFATRASGQSQSPYNGTLWNSVSADERTIFVIGYDKGFSRALKVAGSSDASLLGPLPPRTAAAPQSALDKLLRRAPRLFRTVSYGEVINEMTLFYKDYRNTAVCWGDAEHIALFVLTGGTPSEAELAAFRSEDAKEDCRW